MNINITTLDFIPPSTLLVLKGGAKIPSKLRKDFIVATVPRFTTFTTHDDDLQKVLDKTGVSEVAREMDEKLGDQSAIARYKASILLQEEVGTVFTDEIFNGKNGLLWMDTGGTLVDSKLFYTIDPAVKDEILQPFIDLTNLFPEMPDFVVSLFNESHGYIGDIVVSNGGIHSTYDEENVPVCAVECQIIHQYVLNECIDLVSNAMKEIKPSLDSIVDNTLQTNEERKSISLDDFLEWM